ncbi:MAG: hypothetical protein O3B89_05705, partial [Verrucomicrobia bacterium]|nr:hypothetical protein [Verrucomicrobiota bacterium]
EESAGVGLSQAAGGAGAIRAASGQAPRADHQLHRVDPPRVGLACGHLGAGRAQLIHDALPTTEIG